MGLGSFLSNRLVLFLHPIISPYITFCHFTNRVTFLAHADPPTCVTVFSIFYTIFNLAQYPIKFFFAQIMFSQIYPHPGRRFAAKVQHQVTALKVSANYDWKAFLMGIFSFISVRKRVYIWCRYLLKRLPAMKGFTIFYGVSLSAVHSYESQTHTAAWLYRPKWSRHSARLCSTESLFGLTSSAFKYVSKACMQSFLVKQQLPRFLIPNTYPGSTSITCLNISIARSKCPNFFIMSAMLFIAFAQLGQMFRQCLQTFRANSCSQSLPRVTPRLQYDMQQPGDRLIALTNEAMACNGSLSQEQLTPSESWPSGSRDMCRTQILRALFALAQSLAMIYATPRFWYALQHLGDCSMHFLYTSIDYGMRQSQSKAQAYAIKGAIYYSSSEFVESLKIEAMMIKDGKQFIINSGFVLCVAYYKPRNKRFAVIYNGDLLA